MKEIFKAADNGVPAPLRTLPARVFLTPLSWIWTAGHRRNLARGLASQRTLQTRVISVGGLAMGGAGKSPVVEYLAGRLHEMGRNPAILTRGYRKKSAAPMVVTPRGEKAAVELTGDEAQVFVRAGHAHVGIGSDRFAVGRQMEQTLHPGVFLLDDGFQHFRLKRDEDLVLIDALDPLAGGMFPLGRRREPLESLARATAVIVTRLDPGQGIAGIERMVRRYNSRAPVFRSHVVPLHWIDFEWDRTHALNSRPFGPVAAFCGLGSPRSFWHTLEALGVEVVFRWEFGDHHAYRPAELRRLAVQASAAGAQALVTTEKDIMNLCQNASELLQPHKLFWLKIGVEIGERTGAVAPDSMRIAIFGGTFDPIHSAHLVVAREAADTFFLDRVLFIPAANPPHKETGAPYEDRYQMVELACAEDYRFLPSRLEEGLEKSYSIHTIERVKAPTRTVFFIIGADAFAEIRTWYRWEDVIASVEFIVVTRPGHEYETPSGARVRRLDTVALPVSSSEIRQELSKGETTPDLPPKVAEYIRTHGLYR